jgi:hypothetical protein
VGVSVSTDRIIKLFGVPPGNYDPNIYGEEALQVLQSKMYLAGGDLKRDILRVQILLLRATKLRALG